MKLRPPSPQVAWILNEVAKYLSSELRVRRSDVRAAWQGWRPLATDPHAEPGSPVSRDHIVSTHPETGVTFVTGGKWTTYREMAEDVVDRAIARAPALADKWGAVACTSLEQPLLGGKGYTRNTAAKLVQKYSVAEDVARHLAKTCALFDARARARARFRVSLAATRLG